MLCLAQPASAQSPDIPDLTFQRLVLDPAYATLAAQIDHMGVAPFTFTFDDFSATLDIGTQELHATKLTAEVRTASLDLPAPPAGFLDTILGPDWLRAAAFPTIRYSSDGFDRTGPRTARVTGKLTLLGVSAPLTLHVYFHGGYAEAPWEPVPRLGFTATGSFERADFGLTEGLPPPGTRTGVGNRIGFRITAEFKGLDPL
ncbi:MAG: YceI family protein [Pseudomonadota bacterium]